MGERHDRSVKSASSTILGYVEEIRSLLSKEDGFQANVNGRLSTEDSKNVEAAIKNIEEIIKKYWGEAGLQGDDLNVKWKILIMAVFMENLIHDTRPERLQKTHGEMESIEQVKRLDGLCNDLYLQVQRLKDIVSKNDRP
jgi:hypothetical protein